MGGKDLFRFFLMAVTGCLTLTAGWIYIETQSVRMAGGLPDLAVETLAWRLALGALLVALILRLGRRE